MSKLLVDSFGRIGYNLTDDGPWKESLIWFSDDFSRVYCAEGSVYVEDAGGHYYLTGVDRVSIFDDIYQGLKTKIILGQTNGRLELDYFCKDFTALDLPSLYL